VLHVVSEGRDITFRDEAFEAVVGPYRSDV